jgi:hypothetical protein
VPSTALGAVVLSLLRLPWLIRTATQPAAAEGGAEQAAAAEGGAVQESMNPFSQRIGVAACPVALWRWGLATAGLRLCCRTRSRRRRGLARRRRAATGAAWCHCCGLRCGAPRGCGGADNRGACETACQHASDTCRLLCLAGPRGARARGAPVAQYRALGVYRGGVGSYPTRSNFSGQVTPSN